MVFKIFIQLLKLHVFLFQRLPKANIMTIGGLLMSMNLILKYIYIVILLLKIVVHEQSSNLK